MTTAVAPFVIWDDSWVIGVREIDAQHKNLVSILNQLHQARKLGQGQDALKSTLHNLVSYTRAHFAAEERLMERCAYPDLAAHRKQHELLTAKVLEFQQDFDDGRTGLGVDIMQFLRTWLLGHIRGTDTRYVPCLHAAGVL